MSKISHGWAEASLESRIAAHVQAWQKIKALAPTRPVVTYPFITLSREFGCEARPLAARLVEMLNTRCHPTVPWVEYDRQLLDKVADELHLRREILDALDGRRRDAMTALFDSMLNLKMDETVVYRKLAEVIRSLAMHGHSVLVGRGSYLVTHDLKTGLHVRLIAPRSYRIYSVADKQSLSHQDAEKVLMQGEKEREHFLQTFFVHDAAHPFPHDLALDCSRFNMPQMAEIIFAALSARFGEKLVSD